MFKNPDNSTTITIKLRWFRNTVIGDKFSPNYAQKSTTGLIVPVEDMPVDGQGSSPSIIVNPHCISTRMTISYFLEMLGFKKTLFNLVMNSANSWEKFDYNDITKIMLANGFESLGYKQFYDGRTGLPFVAELFGGFVQLQALKHHPYDKWQIRTDGPRRAITRQPLKGKSVRGGIRFGEMERDAMISHGAAAILQDRLCNNSDPVDAVLCQDCGYFADFNMEQSKFQCKACGSNFLGKKRISYGLKLVADISLAAGMLITLTTSDMEQYLQTKFKTVKTQDVLIGGEEEIIEQETELLEY
jgi:DNA-directed RNA polymerase beta subunit